MTRRDLNTVSKLLTSLEEEELKQVVAKASLLLGSSRIETLKESVQQGKEDWLIDGFFYILAQRGILKHGQRVPYKNMVPDGFWEKYENTKERLIYGTGKEDLSYPELLLLGRVAGEALAQWFQTWKDPPALSLNMMLTNTQNVLTAVDDSFPGYMASRLLHFTLGERVERKRLQRR